PQVYLTGFSGGGLIAYRMIFKHPNLLAGAAPVCANFWSKLARDPAHNSSVTDRNFPIVQISGAEDPLRHNFRHFAFVWLIIATTYIIWKRTARLPRKPRVAIAGAGLATFLLALVLYGEYLSGVHAQADTAARRLRELGYSNLTRLTIPGMGHEPAPELVIQSFKPYWLHPENRSDSRADGAGNQHQ